MDDSTRMGNVAGFEPVLVMDVWDTSYCSITSRLNGRNTSKPFSQTLTGSQSKAGFKRDIKKPKIDAEYRLISVTVLDSDLGDAGRHRAANAMEILELLQ